MESDYRMALLLERQINHENSISPATDFHLALKLQDDFDKEFSVENSVSLVYDHKKTSNKDTRSLVDPSWELVDPTPNIHNLFVVFNQRFFWDKLQTVCVSWSKKMTSCAGVCSYHGRGGLCSITLSEPLLKLRPRKDLVETLLHEMIHAYLFVTHSNRDRDGHGPEFHKQMYRINKEAGTNITVYHSFHDEVKLYQQHWWRCNGSCQNRKPFFGMVRRATNRAPGPNDRWWEEHSRSCGGIFIKVKEPEKKTKSQKEIKATIDKVPASDIRNFIPIMKKDGTTNVGKDPVTRTDNVHTLNNFSSSTQNGSKVSQVFGVGNIHGLNNLSIPQKSVTNTAISNGNFSNKFSNVSGQTQTKSNSSSTIVINKKSSTSKSDTNIEIKNNIETFSGLGNSLTSPKTSSAITRDDYSIVRNHWATKFASSSATKRNNLDSSIANETPKKQKTTEGFHKDIELDPMNMDDHANFVNCPVCQNQVMESSLNSHLDICLIEQDISDKKQVCFVCNEPVSQCEYRNHVDKCLDSHNGEDNEDLIECEICNTQISKKRIEMHRRLCIENMFAESSQNSSTCQIIPSSSKTLENTESDVLHQCPVCDDFIESSKLNNHTEKCLLKVFDDLEKKHNLERVDEEVSCLVCNKKVRKSELNIHLDDCIGGVFDENTVPNKHSNTNQESQAKGGHNCDSESNKYNCPFCMDLYSELDMSGHLDQCLTADMDNSEKSILIESFSNDDV